MGQKKGGGGRGVTIHTGGVCVVAQKHNAIKAAGKTRIGNLARPGRGGAGGGGFLDNLK